MSTANSVKQPLGGTAPDVALNLQRQAATSQQFKRAGLVGRCCARPDRTSPRGLALADEVNAAQLGTRATVYPTAFLTQRVA